MGSIIIPFKKFSAEELYQRRYDFYLENSIDNQDKTNAEIIRSMSDDELAYILSVLADTRCPTEKSNCHGPCLNCWKEFLQEKRFPKYLMNDEDNSYDTP